MTFEDWRDIPPADLAPLYQAESRRWHETLGWDLAPSWAIVEEARQAGRVPGLVARNGHTVPIGWAFYVLHEGVLQVGGLVGESAAAVRGLLDRILQSPEARLARGFTGFLFPGSASVQSALERQRFLLTRHLYLERALTEADAAVTVGDGADAAPAAASGHVRVLPFAQADPADVVRLMARAYAGRPEARCFAPDGRLEQWAHYVGQLLAMPAIGVYLPSASFVVKDDGGRLLGTIVTTSLSRGTAHIAQVVVHPDCRRAGLARRLVDAACGASQAAGHSRVTLLVAESNEPARTLYARLGFAPSAHFLYATRPALARRVIFDRQTLSA